MEFSTSPGEFPVAAVDQGTKRFLHLKQEFWGKLLTYSG
jgi:hypothetical protein